jgi:hypothetical protein
MVADLVSLRFIEWTRLPDCIAGLTSGLCATWRAYVITFDTKNLSNVFIYYLLCLLVM